ncbi:MAG: hypothetical protein HOD92_22190 [Deltaproteobacteria bacterium]|jgi:photosystem II stability/assembly factor-like uncharacterized protein|nr:hypothetical protein [Deltaproteobacteria bacterium]MBT4525078.1 hypothetical protein [Deltaproteobacteria bacterium]
MKKSLWMPLLVTFLLLFPLQSFLLAQETELKDMLYTTAIKYNRTGYIYQSEDLGVSWEIAWDGRIHAKTLNNRVTDIVFGDGRLVAVGNTILMSQNGGKDWNEIILRNYPYTQMFTSNQYIKSVAYGNGFFVAAASKYILYSKDGMDWKYVRVEEMTAAEKRKKKYGKYDGNYPPDKSEDLMFPLDIEYAEGRFYVSGGSRECAIAVYEINEKEKLVRVKKTSLKKRYAEKALLASGGLNSIIFDGYNSLVALSNSNKYAFSTDMGVTWNFSIFPGNIPGSAVTFGNGVWWAVSKEKDLYSSNDIGVGWQLFSEELIDIEINNIAFLNEQLFIVGNNGKIFSSFDGLTWEESLIADENLGLDILSIASAQIEFEYEIEEDASSDTFFDTSSDIIESIIE